MNSHRSGVSGESTGAGREVHPPDRLTILLAEDDGELRSMLSVVLRRDGHRVLELRDGADLHDDLALFFLDEANEPEGVLVVADLRMPVMDTLRVMRSFRARGHRPPFILMTAFGDQRTHDEAQALGALAVFDKPFDFDDLRRAVRSFAAARCFEH